MNIPLKQVPKANRTATGWAVHTADQATQHKIISQQAEWAPAMGAIKAEVRELWHSYIIHDCPRMISDWHGKPLDYNLHFHFRHGCNRPQHCRQCGKAGHGSDACTLPEQCPNCLEPAPADHKDCPLQPKVVRGVVHRADQKQRKAIRTLEPKNTGSGTQGP